jgi:predicted RNA polymerase sigma factor
MPGVVEHLFRHEAGKMVDVVPEALARALRTWPFYGVPENPSAWIMRTSRNLALDVVRRVSKWHYGGGRACEAKLALGIEGETSDRNLLHKALGS